LASGVLVQVGRERAAHRRSQSQIRRREVDLVLQAVRRSGVGADVEAILVPQKTGRPRKLKAEVFFVGAVVVAMKGLTLTLDNIHKALTEWLPLSVQLELGTRIKAAGQQSEPIKVRQVRYLFSAIERRLAFTVESEPGLTDVEREIRSEALQSIIDKLIGGSVLQSMPKEISLAWDSSGVESFGKPKWPATAVRDETDVDFDDLAEAVTTVQSASPTGDTTKKNKKKTKGGKVPKPHSIDRDAHLGYRTKTYDSKSTKLFGYDLFAGVAVLPVGADPDEMPKLLLAMTLRPAAGSTSKPTLALLDRMMENGYRIDELIVDRGFSYKNPKDWAIELHSRGISQVQDIHPADHGVRDHEGIRVVNGVPYCVKKPDALVDNPRPPHFKVGPLKKKATDGDKLNRERNLKDLKHFQDHEVEREPYAFVFHENNPTAKDPFNSRWICPGKAGKVQRELCPGSADYGDDRPVVLNPGPRELAPKCCTQQTVSIPGPVLVKLRQRNVWGSPDWIESFSRRTHIEGIFGNLRNPSTQNIKRGFCRVTGLVKTSLMLTFEVIAANIRVVRKWSRRTGLMSDPLCAPMPTNYGFEELDENGQICLAMPFTFDDPPDDLAA
jgi:hypothetical protein